MSGELKPEEVGFMKIYNSEKFISKFWKKKPS